MTIEKAYICNLCKLFSIRNPMKSLVKNKDHTQYMVSVPEDSNNIHLCDNCIKLLNITDTSCLN